MKNYDYIISGSGASGLSLLMRMMRDRYFDNKQILVADKVKKNINDRTWCFWEQSPGLFEPVAYNQWQQVHFYSSYFSSLLDLSPYRYKMIRGVDFYNYVLGEAARHSNITFQYGQVEALGNEGAKSFAVIDGSKYYAEYIFNSIIFIKPAVPNGKYYLLQHFKGWMIETPEPFFEPGEATLMDFRVSQEHGTTFGYVLPVSESKALVEYTLFTKDLLPREEYVEALRNYTSDYLGITNYEIIEEEFGVIPMTNIKFPKSEGRIMHLGTAGGQTKASSGYTFQFIQKQTAAIVQSLVEKQHPFYKNKMSASRFNFYDSTLLNILYNNKLNGDRIFSDLFRKNPAERILRFLDNESTLEDELNIVGSLPTGIFLQAALKEIFN